MTLPTSLMPPAVAFAAATVALSLKLCCVCLKWLAHSSIAAPVAAATFPPFTEPPEKPERTTSPAASHAADLLVSCSPSLIKLCDEMADRGASLARQGRVFDAFTLIAIPDEAVIRGAGDIALLAWAARLGYREGEALRASGARR
jgi:hypothetical protein